MSSLDIFKPLSTLLQAALSINLSDSEKFPRNFFGSARAAGCEARMLPLQLPSYKRPLQSYLQSTRPRKLETGCYSVNSKRPNFLKVIACCGTAVWHLTNDTEIMGLNTELCEAFSFITVVECL